MEDPGVSLSVLELALPLLSMYLFAIYLTFMCLNFLIYKMRMIQHVPHWGTVMLKS
jgi:hypothetical protein